MNAHILKYLLFSIFWIQISLLFSQDEPEIKTFTFGDHRLNFGDATLADDGTLLITGFSHRDSAGTNKLALYGAHDLWLVKLKKDLTIDWIKCFGGTRDETNPKIITYKKGYLLVSESSSYLSGNKKSSGSGNTDLWMLFLDKSGNVSWQESYWSNNYYSLKDVLVLREEKIIITGKNELGAFILEADSTGKEIRKKTFPEYEGFFNSKSVENGTLILNGYRTELDQGRIQSVYQEIITLDTALNETILHKFYSYLSTAVECDLTDILSFVSPTISGKNYILSSTQNYSFLSDSLKMATNLSDYRVIKLDQAGQGVWDKTFGGNQSEILTHAITTSDNKIILCGYSNSSRGGDKSEILHGTHVYKHWLIALDQYGNKIWDKTIPGTTKDLSPRKLIEITAGSYYCVGTDNTGITVARINYKRI